MSSPVTTTRWMSAAAAATPDAVAVIAGSSSLTYAQLAVAAERWLDRLAELDLADGAMVGVVARRTLPSVAQLWAVWESAYGALLLDPDSPVASDRQALAEWGIGAVLDGDDVTEPDDAARRGDPNHHSWILTSGSTGRPRPVILTHANVAAAVAASHRLLGNGPHDRWQLSLPLSHVGGASVLWRSAAAGGTVVLDEAFDARRTAQRLGDGAITFTSLVPTMLHRVLALLEDVSPDVCTVLVGGAAASEQLVRRALDVGVPVVTTYGLTEACSQVATVAPGEMETALGTCGRPLDGMVVAIEEPDAAGVGLITVDGPAVSPGYVGEPPRVGPHRTDDLGRLDATGRLVVIGRRDDVIITGGENVVPAVVERVLLGHPAVQQAAVVGVAEEAWGEVVVAFVVGAGEVDVEQLEEFAHSRLRPPERPKRYVQLDALPELPNGKVDRRRIAALFAPTES